MVRRPVKEFSGEDSGEEEQRKETEEDEPEASAIDAGLTRFAKKMPMFEPERVDSDSKEKPLTVNLDLALYRAKVLARSFRYEEAEAILQKVRCLNILVIDCNFVISGCFLKIFPYLGLGVCFLFFFLDRKMLIIDMLC